ncbi:MULTISPECIES: YXWGXW repeat-containing protein [unclassified Pseudomonas]|uniref:YXWGXW repeat-containing protein n=1 Tax=unclassified Pseudomonas TaxID=196821 RepID=UPI002AC96011|nr:MULTISPECIES: YXWGXW repeat-containing protein [unclassified Pseudomonas]MEB0045549.1 YXWGXW repeat-containing protein [Pseudomonas sp. Dout3]MEB0095432.1 YXWGXW repeat-containing protein [Pseudomonas sp. DC1.2]WPX61016.1 YXWGXW repeat-containing protein [Pseudomonas sp. DC1.2]
MPQTFKTMLIAGLMAVTLSGCIIAPQHPHRPPPRYEVVPVMPAPGYHWVEGHYRWGGNQWLWVPGHWRAY